MIIWDGVQGTDEWLLARSAIPTASSFSKIITSTGKLSSTRKTYMNQLLADWLAGKPVDVWEGNQAMQDGNTREDTARLAYEFMKDVEVEQVGLVYLDERKLISCSPDGLVGTDGLFETKNPKAATLVGYMLKGGLPTAYKQQVQGQMWVCEREWCDFWVQHPDIPEPFLARVDRDDGFISLMETAVEDFVDEMLECRERLSK